MADRPEEHAQLVNALVQELHRSEVTEPLETLYLGGGTPALLDAGLLAQILTAIEHAVGLDSGVEITLESNPGQISVERLSQWRDLGITRISVGIQTLDDKILARLGRHDRSPACIAAMNCLASDWLGPWSADLLLGWAGQDQRALESDLKAVVSAQPPHISVYGLTVEPFTPLEVTHRLRSAVVSDAHMDFFYSMSMSYLRHMGYDRYEISNFARPGGMSRHNQIYWRNADYLGLGPGAASSRHPFRWTNQRKPAAYMRALATGVSTRARVERLAPLQRLLENLGIGLRTRDGLQLSELDRRFGPHWRSILNKPLEDLRTAGSVRLDNESLRLDDDHLVKADAIVGFIARHMSETSDI